MHGLPIDFDGGFFVGRVLQQVCFNENQISLRFDSDVGITIEGAYAYQDTPVAEDTLTLHPPASSSSLMQLLGHSVSRVESTREGTLSLFFDNGHGLRCFDTPHYESYQIRHGARVTIL
jgi:hypothetical protein